VSLLLLMPDGLQTPLTAGQEEVFSWTATPRYSKGITEIHS